MTGRLVFDGRCGFCTRSVGWLRRVDRHRRVDLVPLQRPGVPESIGSTGAECLDRVQWLGADGARSSGARAVNAALGAALGSSIPLSLYHRTSAAQERTYRWVADNRYRLPGATPHCASHPHECGPA